MATVEFITTEFERFHGKAPRGFGSWAFCLWQVKDDADYLDKTFWVNQSTYSGAKKKAKEYFLAGRQPSENVRVCVLP